MERRIAGTGITGVALALCCLLVGSPARADVEGLREAATAFVASLSAEQRKKVIYALKDDARATWSNLPTLMAPPAEPQP